MPAKGQKTSEATRAKQRVAALASWTEQARKNFSESRTGRKRSNYERQRVSEGMKALWASRTHEEKGLSTAGWGPAASGTSLELAVESVLSSLGEVFEPQKRIGRFRPDFFLPRRNLIIEADGRFWHEGRDHTARDRWLESQGYRVVRLSEADIRRDVVSVVKAALS